MRPVKADDLTFEQAAVLREDAAFRQGFLAGGEHFAPSCPSFTLRDREAMEAALAKHREIVNTITTEES